MVCPQIEIMSKFPKAAQPRFSPISRPFWVRVGVRVRVRARARRWVGTTPVPLSDQEVLFARKREQSTIPTIRAANLLGELTFVSYRLVSKHYSTPLLCCTDVLKSTAGRREQ